MLDRRHKPSIPASAGVGEVLPPAADRQSEGIDVGVEHLPLNPFPIFSARNGQLCRGLRAGR